MNRNTKHVGEMAGFRKPTDDESKRIYQYMRNCYRRRYRSNLILSWIFVPLGIMLLTLYPSRGIAAVIVGLFSFAISMLTIILIHSEKGYAKIYKKQEYRVLEGYVSEVATNTIDNVERIKFTSWEGQCFDRWYDVNATGLKIGDRLLLIDPNPRFLEPHIFTSDMLGK